MSSAGRRLLSALVFEGDVHVFLNMQLREELFMGTEVDLFNEITSHVGLYGKLPHAETLTSQAQFEDSLTDTNEPSAYYLKEVERRFTHSRLKTAIIQAQEALKEEDPDTAFKAVSEVVLTLSRSHNRKHLFNFKEAYGMVMQEYSAQKADLGESIIKFGWDTVDDMTGGIRSGDMVSFVGRPASGKTYMLLNCAMHNWRECEQPVLFVTMEMSAMSIMQRLAAMYTHKPVKNIMKAALSTKAMNAYAVDIKGVAKQNSPLWLVDGNLSTKVDDVVMLCRQLNPRAVFIDGTYLLRNKNVRLSKWERITENAEELKRDVATEIGTPVICSYQLSRDAVKKKKADKVDLEDIYGTDAIGQLSTVVLGLFEAENIGTMIRRKINILKGRNGEIGEFHTNWNFNMMDFRELIEPKLEDLQHLG